MAISTHAPRAGSDATDGNAPKQLGIFQPTLPVRGATDRDKCIETCRCISTHAPRAGSDDGGRTGRPGKRNFNPRSPCGERQTASRMSI